MLARWFTFIADDAPKRGALIMVGKTRESIFRNIFEPLDNDPTLAVFAPFIHYRQGAPTAQMFGRTVHIIGANDAKAESKLRGMTVGGSFVDELTMLPKEFFKQLLGRMSVPGAQAFVTTNPDAPLHWLKTDYLDKIGDFPDWYVEHFTMDDNPSLTVEYRTSIEREYTGLWYRRFIKGEWVAAEGAIYPEFDTERNVITRAQLPNIERVLISGLDYGTTHRTRAYLIGMGRRADGELALYVLSEFAPDTATVGQHAAMYRAWIAGSGFVDPEWHAVDPAAAVMRQQLFDDERHSCSQFGAAGESDDRFTVRVWAAVRRRRV
jgi:PBSX family phage terminase large subunit